MSIQEPIQSDSNLAKEIPLGIFGALLGAVVGFFVFQALTRRGLYFIVLPGAAVGFGCGLAARSRSFVVALIAVAVAIPATIFYEWKTDLHSLGIVEYTSRMVELRGWKLPVFIGLNGLIAFWFGRRG